MKLMPTGTPPLTRPTGGVPRGTEDGRRERDSRLLGYTCTGLAPHPFGYPLTPFGYPNRFEYERTGYLA
eukprot:6735691-Pyramimonas_sp.AAC.1